jgi:hypothetical protein
VYQSVEFILILKRKDKQTIIKHIYTNIDFKITGLILKNVKQVKQNDNNNTNNRHVPWKRL